jgi:hypothetical protein
MTGRPARSFYWPYLLLAAMSLVSFGGPFLVLFVVQGGVSADWPPDRALEWITIGLVVVLFVTLFAGCTTLGWWYAPLRQRRSPRGR